MKVIGSNPGYLLKSFLFYENIQLIDHYNCIGDRNHLIYYGQKNFVAKNWKQRVEFFEIQRHLFTILIKKSESTAACWCINDIIHTCFFHRMSGQFLKQNTIPPLINCLWSNTIHKIVKLLRSLALFKRQLLQFNRSVVTVWKIFFLYQFMRGHVICIQSFEIAMRF